jgi:hypothetical protein
VASLLVGPRELRFVDLQLLRQFLLTEAMANGRQVAGTCVQNVEDGGNRFRERHAGRTITLRRVSF